MGDGLRNRKKIRLLAICIAMSVASAEELSREKSLTAPNAAQRWIWSKRMNENKYYLKIDNRIIAERVSLEHALIFIKSIFENYYNDHEIVISIAEMRRYEDDEVNE